jgi:hypothetical protein
MYNYLEYFTRLRFNKNFMFLNTHCLYTRTYWQQSRGQFCAYEDVRHSSHLPNRKSSALRAVEVRTGNWKWCMQGLYTAHRAPHISVLFPAPEVAQLTKNFSGVHHSPHNKPPFWASRFQSRTSHYVADIQLHCSAFSGVASLRVPQLKLSRHFSSTANLILTATECGWKLQITKLFVCYFLHPPATSYLLRSNIIAVRSPSCHLGTVRCWLHARHYVTRTQSSSTPRSTHNATTLGVSTTDDIIILC